MTRILQDDPQERRKWRAQAAIAAEKLKRTKFPDSMHFVKVGFVFDDAVVTLNISIGVIKSLPAEQLGTHIYDLIVNELKKGAPA